MVPRKRIISLALAAALLLSCAACGGAKAASMWLVKTEGSVAVTDGEGSAVALTDRLGLFSGYGINTQAASYGWIDLDETKLTKMDENSDVEVQKEGKNLVLTVNSGSLFFNVTKPLAADETLEIRSSDMVTAIRGTCGWVEVPDPGHMNVFILEGTVECSVGGVTESVTAGQTAAISAADSTVTVQAFSAADIPAFVSAETEADQALTAAVQALPDPVELALEQYRTIVGQAASYDFGGSTPTGAYRYVLVQMEPEDAIPTLLLEQQVDEYLYHARVFQYDPASGAVIQPADILRQGWTQTEDSFENFSGWLTMEEDGRGLLAAEFSKASEFSSGTLEQRRATLNGGSLQMELQRSESLDPDIFGVVFHVLDWHDAGDLSALDSWTPGAGQ